MIPERGFTLVEMAIVLVIVGLLLGGLLMPLSTQVEQRRIGETQKTLDEIREALIGYAANQIPPHLPCPDKTGGGGVGTANDGQEDFNPAGTCVTQEGNIPWATLGVSDVDGWGNRIHYRVDATFSNRSPLVTFSLTSAGTLRACQTAACATIVANTLPAIILSHGRNGYGAINTSGNANPAPTSADELANTDGNTDFVSRPPSPAGSPAGEFDDVVTWLSAGLLNGRMISAQKLP